MCQWKEWKKPKTKVRKLIGLGAPKEKAYEWGNSRKKYWRIAKSLYVRYSQLRQT
jgi:RNA-directed DNA polymerase